MYLCWVLISSSTEVFANLQVNDLKLCKAPPHDNITNKALKSMEGEGGGGWVGRRFVNGGRWRGKQLYQSPLPFPSFLNTIQTNSLNLPSPPSPPCPVSLPPFLARFIFCQLLARNMYFLSMFM